MTGVYKSVAADSRKCVSMNIIYHDTGINLKKFSISEGRIIKKYKNLKHKIVECNVTISSNK